MRASEFVNLAYFALLTALALIWKFSRQSRGKAVLIGLAGLLLNGLAAASNNSVLRDWMPVALMPIAYWQSGCFFQQANPKLQAVFERSEEQFAKLLHVNVAEWAQTRLGTLLELAYVLCYPVVPLGAAALQLAGLSDHADSYWTVVLLSTYPCYALLPFIQLLPPRLVKKVRQSDESRRRFRRFNLWLVRHVTHEANTFPSGHVAASASIALVLLRFAPGVGAVFVLVALGIAFGCVVGRYHYTVDVGAAFLLAATMFALVLS